jgi:uncharacterized protein YndB with AHSA1/START domain
MISRNTEIIALPGKYDFSIIREFEAPNEKLFLAFSEPDYFKQWFMPAGMDFTIQQMDCRTGGSFQNSHTHPNGSVFGFHGVYHEVNAPHTIIKTSEFTGLPQKMSPVLETTCFEPLADGRTKLTIHTVCISPEFRDAMIKNGMEHHLKIVYALLDHLLTYV